MDMQIGSTHAACLDFDLACSNLSVTPGWWATELGYILSYQNVVVAKLRQGNFHDSVLLRLGIPSPRLAMGAPPPSRNCIVTISCFLEANRLPQRGQHHPRNGPHLRAFIVLGSWPAIVMRFKRPSEKGLRAQNPARLAFRSSFLPSWIKFQQLTKVWTLCAG
jgi:hypothetical protein